MISVELFVSGFFAQWRLLLMPMFAAGVGTVLGLMLRGKGSETAPRAGLRQTPNAQLRNEGHAAAGQQSWFQRTGADAREILVTIELSSRGRGVGRTHLGRAAIVNIGDEPRARCQVELFDENDARFACTRFDGRWAAAVTAHELVASGMNAALQNDSRDSSDNRE